MKVNTIKLRSETANNVETGNRFSSIIIFNTNIIIHRRHSNAREKHRVFE